jgi:hypothetical protein
MLNLRLLLIPVAVSASLSLTASAARADGLGCPPGGCAPGAGCQPFGYPKYYSLSGYACPSKPMPVFQAAPWYLYWPYDGHFLTPAPVTGAFYGPPTPGNFPVNPYFPGPSYGYGYGPIPGGPPPRP